MKCTFMVSSLLGTVISAQAALLAHYDFTDGDLTDNEVGAPFTLNKVVNGTDDLTITTEGAASFPGDDGDAVEDYLQVAGPGGVGSFTVSLWFKPPTVNQGGFQGIFSNLNVNSANNFSWQLDVNSGTLRFISATTGFTSLTNGTVGQQAIQANEWNHVIVRKTSAGGAELWLGTEGTALELLGSNATNPGGLQQFRLGVNRNSDSFYEMEMANVKIYNDASVSLTTLNSEGPQLVPEPSIGLFALLSLPILLRRRR